MPLSRASIRGLTPNREPIRVNELPSAATMKSNSPPAIRCASGPGVARGCAVLAATGGGGGSIDDDEGVGALVGSDWDGLGSGGLEWNQRNALDVDTVSASRTNVATIPEIGLPIEIVTLPL
jgi:hypothetical protein